MYVCMYDVHNIYQHRIVLIVLTEQLRQTHTNTTNCNVNVGEMYSKKCTPPLAPKTARVHLVTLACTNINLEQVLQRQ